MACSETARFDLNDIPIKDAAAVIQQFSHRRVWLGPGVKGLVSLRSLEPVGAEGALRLLLQASLSNGWQAVLDGAGSLVIHKAPAPAGFAGKPDESTGRLVPRIYVLQHRELSSLFDEIRHFLSPRGSIKVVDEHSFLVFDEIRVQWRIGVGLAERDVAQGFGNGQSPVVAP